MNDPIQQALENNPSNVDEITKDAIKYNLGLLNSIDGILKTLKLGLEGNVYVINDNGNNIYLNKNGEYTEKVSEYLVDKSQKYFKTNLVLSSKFNNDTLSFKVDGTIFNINNKNESFSWEEAIKILHASGKTQLEVTKHFNNCDVVIKKILEEPEWGTGLQLQNSKLIYEKE